MRQLVALAILLIGLEAAMSECRDQDSILVTGTVPLSSALGKSDRGFSVVAVPAVESSDAAHDQDEEAAAPPQSPAPASSDADFDTEIAESLDGLCSALMISAQDNDLPVPFFANLIWQESRLRQDAVSPVGALGIAQFMPRVAIAEGVGDPFDPRQAIPASARLLHALRAHFGNLGFVAAAYNAGARRVSEWLDHHRALPRETRTYVVRVTGRTVEAWRKSPLNDSKLTFVRRLPCRELPAFAYFEQARLREAQQQNAAAKVTQKTGMKAPAARHFVVERKEAGKVAHSAATGIMARNFHGRHDAAPRLRVAHEKRRVAQAASSRRES
jgi:hypothetical protein